MELLHPLQSETERPICGVIGTYYNYDVIYHISSIQRGHYT